MLTSLQIQNFKNLNLNLEFQKNIVLIHAPNGSGKTNLLEAIYYSISGTSFKTNSDSEIINWDLDTKLRYFNLIAEFNDSEDISSKQIYFQIGSDRSSTRNKKVLKVNTRSTTPSKFRSDQVAIVFAPESIDLISNSPEIRRDEIDNFGKLYYPNYEKTYSSWKNVLKNRNKLLQLHSTQERDKKLFDYWTDRFIELSKDIVKARIEGLNIIATESEYFAESIYHELPNDKKALVSTDIVFDIRYISKSDVLKKVDTYSLDLGKKLKDNYEKESILETTLYGPHRDDIALSLGNFDIRNSGSRGQQRLASLVLKLSQLKLLKDIGKEPYLILDDIPSELDIEHIKKLEKVLTKLDSQIFITATEQDKFDSKFLKEIQTIDLI